MAASGVAAGASLHAADLSDGPDLVERGYFVEVKNPDAETHKVPGLPWRFALRASESELRPAPMLGEHNHEILSEILGLDATALANLGAEGVIGIDPVAQGALAAQRIRTVCACLDAGFQHL